MWPHLNFVFFSDPCFFLQGWKTQSWVLPFKKAASVYHMATHRQSLNWLPLRKPPNLEVLGLLMANSSFLKPDSHLLLTG